jgi:hypothetical protein
MMMRLLALAVFALLGVSSGLAQEAASNAADNSRDATSALSAPSAFGTTLTQPPVAKSLSFTSATAEPSTSAPLAPDSAEASPAPAPDPRLLYGGRDDFRWQVAIGAAWYRFRSNVFNASAVGIKSSVTYFTNEWFGIEGNATATFAPKILANEHVKLLIYGAGPKVAWRQRRWEPWLHAIVGGSHELPQTSRGGRNSYAFEAGGGADYRQNPRLSYRLEGDWVRSGFFNNTQNNFELMGGIVFHF